MFDISNLNNFIFYPKYTYCAIDAPLKHGLSLSRYDISAGYSKVYITAVTRNDAAAQKKLYAEQYLHPICINIDVENKTLLSLVIEWHKKITVSFACIILFFIGAPLGAIIKKGGLGMPVVVSVFFFLAYYILTEFYVNLANEGHLAPLKAIWMPLIIFLPISVFLTSKAARDSSIFDATSYYSFINKFFSKKNRV